MDRRSHPAGAEGGQGPDLAASYRVTVNNTAHRIASSTLDAALLELGYGGARVATAVNGEFVPVAARAGCRLGDGSVIEILAPMQGG